MEGFIIKVGAESVRFAYYEQEAPVTCHAFDRLLPFRLTLMHARVSGQEIWTDQSPKLDIIQENSSVFTMPGEVVLGPMKPVRSKTRNAMGIYYGEGKGLDGCNIFARAVADDMDTLKMIGEKIWKGGVLAAVFERMP